MGLSSGSSSKTGGKVAGGSTSSSLGSRFLDFVAAEHPELNDAMGLVDPESIGKANPLTLPTPKTRLKKAISLFGIGG